MGHIAENHPKTKGQLILKCPFDVIVLTEIPTIFLRISALASKKRLNQKNKYIHFILVIISKYLIQDFFFLILFLEARAEIL